MRPYDEVGFGVLGSSGTGFSDWPEIRENDVKVGIDV